ncbi:MAG: DUF1223 domain-containing protein [Aestuariivirga sp.]
MSVVDTISRRQVLALGAGVAAACLGAGANAGLPRPVVVELFTSQGCSSCPPADAFFKELRALPNVVALSYHVDYWDYLGWKDTLGSAACSQRQYDYARARGDMNVYTPQMIVDGRGHLVGSKRPAVLEAIRRAQGLPKGISLSLDYKGREMTIEIGSSTSAPESTVWLMPVIPKVAVKILRGENAGREIIYYNVVRTPMPAGMWSGEAKTLSLPKDAVLGSGVKGCVALLQQGKTGPILGSARWGDLTA